MKQKINLAQISRTVLWLGLIFCVGLTAARAQASGTVIPLFCFEAKPETFTRTLTISTVVGSASQGNNANQSVNPTVPRGYYRVVINPGGATEERLLFVRSDPTFSQNLIFSGAGFPSQNYIYPHALGETILLITEGEWVYGYNNTSNAAVNIPRGVSSGNFFAPGPLVYSDQPSSFLPGMQVDVMRFQAHPTISLTWFLNGGQATANSSTGQGCATITYQGRLSDGANAANGQFDLQFQAFDLATGGTAQSGLITLEDVQVTNGVFTAALKFFSSLNNNYKAKFLEIGVRAGTATGAFTTLAPRQPLTQVPYAVNAFNAANATNATNVSGGFVQLPLTTNAPPAAECNETSELGRQKVDAVNNRLYICTITGWKSTLLQ